MNKIIKMKYKTTFEDKSIPSALNKNPKNKIVKYNPAERIGCLMIAKIEFLSALIGFSEHFGG